MKPAVRFRQELKYIQQAFKKERVPYGLIGGLAVGFFAVPRATRDIDLLLRKEDLPRVDRLLLRFGYRLQSRNQEFSRYVNAHRERVDVDVQHAFRSESRSILRRARMHDIAGTELSLRIVQPEDLIGLKVQAAASNRDRRLGDLTDIQNVAAARGRALNWRRAMKYFRLFGMECEGIAIRRIVARR